MPGTSGCANKMEVRFFLQENGLITQENHIGEVKVPQIPMLITKL